MKKAIVQSILILLVLPAVTQTKGIQEKGISFQVEEAGRKVDVFSDGKYFTSYMYPASLEKPILYPVTASSGTIITRGFPLQSRSGERADHPHQVGWWFNYGDVNGLDFWNNSYAIPDSMKSHYGRIEHKAIVKTAGGKEEGILVVSSSWVDWQKNELLNEETTFRFSGGNDKRCIIRTTVLTAVQDIRFGDSKEGLCAIRVDRAFESPSNEPEIFTDACGNPTTVPVLNNEGVNGVYRNSEGDEKDAVWGKRARWVSLSAHKAGEDMSICLFDFPGNPGYPAYWHARGYGLFSVNNLATKAYNSAEPEKITLLKSGESITFRHKLLVKSGGFITREEMEDEADRFVK